MKNNINKILKALLYLVPILVGSLNIYLFYLLFKSNFDNRIEFVAIIATLMASLIAFWQWQVSKRKAQQELFLNTLQIMTNRSEAAYLGASYILKELAKNQESYIIPAISTIENGIRELSENTFNKWVNNCVEKDGKKVRPITNRKTLSAIKDMLEVVVFLREKIKKDAPPINLGFADLRILKDHPYLDEKILPFLRKANLRRADLRYLPIEAFRNMPSGTLEGAWFSLNKRNVVKEEGKREEKGLTVANFKIDASYIGEMRNFLKESKARLFLTGDWSPDSLGFTYDKENEEEMQLEDKPPPVIYREIFMNSRIGGGPGVRLDNLDMGKCDFYNSTMVKASFRGTKLQNVNFMESDLRFCDFTGADIENANFYGAVIDGSLLKNAINVEKALGLRFD